MIIIKKCSKFCILKNMPIFAIQKNQLKNTIMKKYESYMVTLESEDKKRLIIEVLAKGTENAKSKAEKYRKKFQDALGEKVQITNIEKNK